MSSKSLQQILGHMPLTESLRAVAHGIPNPFPQEFFTVSAANRVLGDRASYIRVASDRRTTKLAKYGSPSRRRNLQPISDQSVRMMHTFEEFQIDPNVLTQLRSFEKYQQDNGKQWLAHQIREAAARSQNTRIISTASVLRYGAIYWDSDGNLLPSSSGAAETYDFNVPATHKNQCNGTISASWALHTTDILGDIRNLKQFALQETGLEPRAALYGINVPKYIQQNDYCMSYLARNSAMNEKILVGGEIPDGFAGIEKWIPVWTSFYESDDAGTVSEIWNDDLVTFVPNVAQPDNMTWFVQYEGSLKVPRSIEVASSALAALDNFTDQYGMFMYAGTTMNPPGMTAYSGDVWLPAIRNEKAPYMATVAF